MNKRYEIQLRVEYLKQKSVKFENAGDFLAMAKIEDIIQKYIDKYPDIVQPSGKRNIILFVDGAALKEDIALVEEAEWILMDEIKQIEDNERE